MINHEITISLKRLNLCCCIFREYLRFEQKVLIRFVIVTLAVMHWNWFSVSFYNQTFSFQLNKLLLQAAVPDGEHRLQSAYCLWYSRKSSGKSHQQNFDQNLQLIGSFATCEQFWKVFSHLVRPGDLNSHSDFHLFKKGIKPLWEDEANRYGGKWIGKVL